MKPFSLKSQLALGVSALMVAGSFSSAAFAQNSGASFSDEVITTGTRRKARSAADTPAPVDVISAAEFNNQATSDISDLLRTVAPSFNVNTQPISDAASVIRPANLRGLSPDNTLVLLNGKRRHRGSVISFLGGGISDGAQGVDISVFPAIGLKQIEILRDGASSQYGSDAIAGVMNFQLKDSAEGGSFEVKYGSTYAGDGDNYRVSGNIGLPLGPDGFINISAEYGETDGTVRSVIRGDVAALIAAGNTDVADFLTINSYTDEVPQYWGQPDITDDIKLFINAGIELSENMEIYAFGNYAERSVEGGFFFRNPTNRGGVYNGDLVDPITGALDPNGVASIRVGDLDGLGVGGACPAGIPLTGTNGLIANPTILAAVTADANCFSFVELIPSGFVPRFGGDNRDFAITGGVRGEFEFGTGLGYDLSVSHGTNKTDFFINNTINASLGPNTPRNFVPGSYEQVETAVNLDLVYGVPVAGWASDLNVAAGIEWRDETFDITAGDPASYALGPLADQGFSSSSNGFGGFSESSSNSQSNFGIYGELEADVTEKLTLQTAIRWEDNEKFGDSTNWKVAGLYKLTDTFRLRGSYSTGFHTPTAGQANVKNVTTQNVNGVLIDQGTIPLTSNPGQLAADFIESTVGIRPGFGPETAKNISMGVAFETGPISWTVDLFRIKVKDRIATSDNIAFIDALDFLAAQTGAAGYDNSTVSTAITTLATAGALTRSDYTGFEDLTSFKFFTNSFSTRTQGVDVVARMPLDLGVGSSSLQFAGNITKTKVTDIGVVGAIGATRIQALEDSLPHARGSLTFNHQQGIWRGLVRASYYGPWRDTGNGFDVGSEFLFDAEIAAEVMEGVELIVGAANIFDNFPDENPGKLGSGQLYPESSPTGFSGGQWYVKARYTF
ncbi:MAG: TonB-dependent receptor [Robiginitomaculum sp.]|nr:MAG: TonB-dependent receptor [Robiginitomaculum sp.]